MTILNPACDRQFGRYVFGIDEVGLGPLAGPLLVVCCALDLDNAPVVAVKDSKKLSEKQREKLFDELLLYKPCHSRESGNPEDYAVQLGPRFRGDDTGWIYWGAAAISAPDLDAMGIPAALKHGVHTAYERCQPPFKPDHILMDGNRQYTFDYPCTSVIKGDSLHYTIALASVIAKVLRDRWMRCLDTLYPEFGFAKHKGYGTKQHLDAIHQGHISPHHRRSYEPIKSLTL